MMNSETNNHIDRPPPAFTLVELIIVMVIISAMVTVVLPYAASSNKNLQLRNGCLNIAEALAYALDVAAQANKPTRVVINPKGKSYHLQMAMDRSTAKFTAMPGAGGAAHYIGQAVEITDVEGFDMAANEYCLVFDPAETWPNARLSLSTVDATRIIRIMGKRIEIESAQI
jgi:prepilin-type N-terminal cleavage/methylation domain-containing protein